MGQSNNFVAHSPITNRVYEAHLGGCEPPYINFVGEQGVRPQRSLEHCMLPYPRDNHNSNEGCSNTRWLTVMSS
jgi:hypothetical protein